ncbi:MAG: zinc-dependent metalloprotease [Chitinophagaceae bacterium]|nr:zinc-dependent metalloprotease [Chitinophagaceae bacterium]
MTKRFLKLASLPLLLGMAMQVDAQDRRPQPTPAPGTPPVAVPAGANGQPPAGQRPPAAPQKGPKPYKEVITEKAKSQKGLFNVHVVEDKYYLELGDTLLGRDLLVVNRIGKGAAGVRNGFSGFAGDIISEQVIRFTKGPEDRIFLHKVSFRERATDSTQGMYKSVMNNSIQPILYSLSIAALSKDSAGSVIEITSLINSDNDLLFFDAGDKRSFSLGSMQPDKSYTLSVKTYPTNLNIRTVKTYTRTPAGGPSLPGGFSFGGGSADPATFELNSSWVVLPKTPMKSRYWDDRVGYFSTSYVDFDANPQGVKDVTLARRWRLEPKPQDVERYKRGELVEPQKPIIFYIDPTTPKKWIPYLMQGVNDWQIAFEKAGFKNAIMAKMAPTPDEDPTWSLEDARYSAIVYKPSDIPNASGPNVQDPRSGEIIESHINWYHNVMRLLRDWYMVQTAAVDPRARKVQFDDELMGQLIRFVSSHEVGHTLGLRHNFGSSSTVPVEKLRDKAWVEANGHTPSIMDYARFNYVAQPEDNVSEKGLFPRIGDYDLWAIEWAYRWYDTKSADDDKETLNKLVLERLKNPRNWWGDGESYGDDPRSQTEDLSDDAMKASSYGIKNLQRILPNLIEWTKEPGEGYDELQSMYNQVTGQFGRYIGHVARNIGGIERTPKTVEQAGAIYNFTAKARQKEAMKWLQDNVFKTPTWVIDQRMTSLTNQTPQSVIAGLQSRALSAMFSANTAGKLLRFEAEKPAEAYSLFEMMTDLRKGIFSELAARKAVDVYRRSLQKDFTERLLNLVKPAAAPAPQSIGGLTISFGPSISPTSDLLSVAKAQARTLLAEIKAAQPLVTDNATKMHLADLADRIERALKKD